MVKITLCQRAKRAHRAPRQYRGANVELQTKKENPSKGRGSSPEISYHVFFSDAVLGTLNLKRVMPTCISGYFPRIFFHVPIPRCHHVILSI